MTPPPQRIQFHADGASALAHAGPSPALAEAAHFAARLLSLAGVGGGPGETVFDRSAGASRPATPVVAALPQVVEDRDFDDIRATLGGDRDAFARLVERHQNAIARHMFRFSRDRTVYEELVQDVFVEAFQSLGTFRARAPFLHWLRKIATRVGYRHWRRSARRRLEPTVPMSTVARQLESDVDGLAATDAAEYAHVLLSRLRSRDRLVLTLMYLEGCSVAEAADRTGWSQTMVKVQAHRARKRLRALVDTK